MIAYWKDSTLNGVVFWSGAPLSPNSILPIPSRPKHIEKEFAASPLLARMLGTDILSIPSPNRPLTAAPSIKSPVWIIPHLKQNY